jgi:F-type H+-transporting ATPase subunit b
MLVATSNFLLPNATIIPEFIAFLVVLGVIAKFVVPPINKAIEERQRNIATALEAIDEAKVRQAAVEAEAKRIVDEAREQARRILDEANRSSEEIVEAARRRAEEEHVRLLARSEAEIAQARRQAELSLVSEMAELVVRTAERVIQAEIDGDRHRSLIEESIQSVSGLQGASDAPAARGD